MDISEQLDTQSGGELCPTPLHTQVTPGAPFKRWSGSLPIGAHKRLQGVTVMVEPHKDDFGCS